MGRKMASCRSKVKAKRRPRNRYPEETERFVRRLTGPKCCKPYRDENGEEKHHCTTVNFTREIRSHPNDSMCLCCRDSRRRISEKVWNTRTNGAFIGVSLSKQELEVKWTDRKDGRRFPVNRYHRTNALVETFQALWCELDRGSVREQWDRLRSFGVFPTMIVWSGGKSLHAYWVLAESTDRERFNSVMPRLCAQLLGDGKTIPAMHQLRLPGSIHSRSLERGRLRRARLIHDDERFPAIEEIEAALTLSPEEVTAYMDTELGRKPGSGRAAGAKHPGDAADQHTVECEGGGDPQRAAADGLDELRAFDDGGDEAILNAAHRVFGDLRRGERHATTLDLIRWCHRSVCLPKADTCRIVKQFILRYPGTSEGANERLGQVTSQVDALVANWYGKVHVPGIDYASIEDLEDCVREIAALIPPEWTQADAGGFHDWLTGFIRYLTAVAHRRGLSCFRRHSLHMRLDIERLGRRRRATHESGRNAPHDCHKRDEKPSDLMDCSQGLSRDGRRMAYRGFRHLLSTGFVVQVAEYLPDRRTRLYDIAIPIVSPQAWEWHRHETTAEWSARGAEWDADGESLRGVLSGRRRSQRD